ncbi:gpW family head-tail joining protein [Telmatospirillum sp.]|uniref:gpW family head-tail joining protein n=1 Tax=Telmatospirillum sp. TaxID=2079197 RepID=UPI002842BBD2|nr:gpW family head-tail joining protein [Telmatospirillum sp.]MDR3438961.1 gpW family head-tail joining protein [Telmatospirillum sp.]
MRDPNGSILAGMSVDVLRRQLSFMQQAYLDLSTGVKGESYSYSQGDGAKSVTYTRANLQQLVQAILQVQAQIDMLTTGRTRRRKPMMVAF